jgi:hypothetical protein
MAGTEIARAAALAQSTNENPGVFEAVATVRVDGGPLLLFAAGQEEISPRRIRKWLLEEHSDAPVPDEVYVLAELPRLNGDIDWESLALLSEDDAPRRADYVPPAPGTQTYLAELWEDLLQMDRVGAQDDFFATGGHSMLAVRMRQAIQRDQRVTVPADVLFANSVLSEQAQAIDEQAQAIEEARS